MSGTDIVGALLAAHAPLIELVPETQIKAGALPDNAPLPSILLRTISSVDRQPLKRGAKVFVTDRIAMTVRAASYREADAITRAARKATAGQTGEIADFTNVAVLTAGLGPDMRGPGNSYEKTQDLKVGFNQPA